MLSATVPWKRYGRCGTHATCDRHAARSIDAERETTDADHAGIGLDESKQEVRSGRLAGAGRPDESDDAAIRDDQVEPVERGGSSARVRDGDPVERRSRPRPGPRCPNRAAPRCHLGPARVRRARRRSARRPSALPRPSGSAIASVRSGRKNSGTMIRTASARSNSIEPSISRRLTSTATTATATAAPHSRTSDVWKAVRSTSIVVSPYRRLMARMLSTCSRLATEHLQRRQAAEHVQEERAEIADLGKTTVGDRPRPATDDRQAAGPGRAL